MHKNQKRLTLVGILGVVGIIAVLMLVVLPAIHRTKSENCIQHLQKMGMALHLYAQDWNGCAPPYTTIPNDYIVYTETKPYKKVDISQFNSVDDLKKCYKQYGVTEDMWWCPFDPCPGKPYSSLSMVDHTKTSYYVDQRLAIWRPVKIANPPVVERSVWASATAVYWNNSKEMAEGGPYYAICWPHRLAGDKFMVLYFDGSVQPEE